MTVLLKRVQLNFYYIKANLKKQLLFHTFIMTPEQDR